MVQLATNDSDWLLSLQVRFITMPQLLRSGDRNWRFMRFWQRGSCDYGWLHRMTDENTRHKSMRPENVGDPKEAEPGRGASGNQWAVQTAQQTNVNPDDEEIPSNVDVERNQEQLEKYAKQEEGTLPTSHGYVIDESGNIDNYAVEPPMRVEE